MATLWVGELGPMERASLASFARFDQTVTVFSYTPLADMPKGFENRDANEILPTETISYYAKENSPSLHSNFFRYHMMGRSEFMWVDLDVIALRPFVFDSEWVYGLQQPDSVNCAVMRVPSDSAVTRELMQYKAGFRGIPPQVTGLRRLKYQIRTLGRGLPIEEWIWGSTGPRAFTAALRNHGAFERALPIDAFYPVAVRDVRQFIEPGRLDDSSFGPDTYGVHLSKSVVERHAKRDFEGKIPSGSYLDLQIAKARAQGFL
ncbi:hypothetical protein [Thioclava sp. GXIMD2076]|uniref:Alpha 1,4-glycosyltransferase domain-containing protein n=1 Tax=Thioclava kandeliae TaxID=3070818 RepID=A0ABV1SDU8_9RHOB